MASVTGASHHSGSASAPASAAAVSTDARYDDRPLLLRAVEVDGAIVDVRVARGVVAQIEPHLAPTVDDVTVEGDGGALLHGLHDHHVHVLATAAARASVSLAADDRPEGTSLAQVLREAARRGPVRAVGYHEVGGGLLDRDALDAIVPDVATRVQHRTGSLWVLNSVALDALTPAVLADARVERDVTGRPTGRIWRADDLLRLGAAGPLPDVAAVGAELAAFGVTAITDATATNDARSVAALARLPQRVRAMGPLDLEIEGAAGVELGEVKVLLDDDSLPALADTIELVRAAHARSRGVAFHCVTLAQLRFTIEVLRVAGVAHDRVEHASVAPPDAIADLRALGVVVATQPGFISARGDDYLRDVDARDVPALYPIASLLAAGIPTVGSSDAPYGPANPWTAMRAAVERRAPSGRVVGAMERVAPSSALGLFGALEPVRAGRAADLALLDRPLAAVMRLAAPVVRCTVVAGAVVHRD